MEMRQPLDSRYGYDFVPQKLKEIVNDRSVDRLFVIKEEDSQMNIWKWLEKVLDKLTRVRDYRKVLLLTGPIEFVQGPSFPKLTTLRSLSSHPCTYTVCASQAARYLKIC